MGQRSIRTDPILIIDVIELAHESATIKLLRPDHPDITIETFWGYNNLAEYYQRYYEGLENFKQELDTDHLDQDYGSLTRAFKALFKKGKVLFEDLFQDSTDEILRYLKSYVDPVKKIAGSRRLHLPVGVIEVRTKNIQDILPVEGLVLVGTESEVNSSPDLIRSASGILGFSFIINRVIKRTRQSQKREFNNIPRLPLKYFWNKSLKGAIAELVFFKRYQDFFCLDGPWPEEYTGPIEEELVQCLWRPDIGFDHRKETDIGERQMDEIHHLSCHCYTDEEFSWQYQFELTGSHPITIEAMEECLVELKYSEIASRKKLEMPMIFFNACGVARMRPEDMTSFPKYFLFRNQNCGFIGSEINIPDSFACEFCQSFYLYLLKGFGVGKAVFGARHKMLERYKNPLGILYTSYVDPYLRVARAVETI